MKVIIAGGRDFNNYEFLKERCDYLFQNQTDVEIVSGNANGADKLGEQYAIEKNYSLKIFKAEWNKYGKGAGFIRNTEMSNYADALIAFWDGTSKGTLHMINESRKKNLKVRIINY